MRVLVLTATHQLPAPACNQMLEIDGKRYEVDLLWERQRVIVEADGGRYHDNRGAFERDRQRDRVLQSAGYRVIRITWIQVEKEADAIMATIRRLLN